MRDELAATSAVLCERVSRGGYMLQWTDPTIVCPSSVKLAFQCISSLSTLACEQKTRSLKSELCTFIPGRLAWHIDKESLKGLVKFQP